MTEKRLSAIVLAVLLLLLAGEIAILAYFGKGTVLSRAGFLLQLVGIYGIGIGFVQKSDLLKNFGGLEDMTSPHPLKFLHGNLLFLGMLSSFAAVALDVNRSPRSSMALGCLAQAVVVLLFPLIFLYFLVHLLLICPIAYIGYLFTSALVEGVTGASGDMQWTSTASGAATQTVGIKDVIASNPSAAKSLLIGLPATLLAFVVKLIEIFFK